MKRILLIVVISAFSFVGLCTVLVVGVSIVANSGSTESSSEPSGEGLDTQPDTQLQPNAAPEPTATAMPLPTYTPTPTATPTPTPTPTETAVPTATPIPTPRPTATPRPTPQPRGLGVDRQSVVMQFEDPAFGFVFEDSPLLDGRQRILGQNPEGAIVELIGQRHNLTEASITVFLSSDDYQNTINVLAMVLLINSTTSWAGGVDWLTNSMLRAVDEGSVSTTYRGYNIKLEFFDFLNGLILQITR